MASFFILVDPDPARRARALEGARPEIAPFPALATGELAGGPLGVVWARDGKSPFSLARRGEAIAVIWGDARPAGSATGCTADDLLPSFPGEPLVPVPPLDGYHVALAFDPEGELVIRADLLGLFPVYYWWAGDVLLAGSSPELFRHHPAFVPQVSPQGLAGILLTGSLVGGRCLLEGVRRLQAGSLLVRTRDGAVGEVEHYRLPISQAYRDMSFSAQVDALGDALTGAVRRAMPADRPASMLLSGGLDSRTLIGVARSLGRFPEAVTMGRAADIELACAARVARVVGLRHHVIDDTEGDRVASAHLKARWEHLANGFFGAGHWLHSETLDAVPPPLLTGYVLDDVMGTKGVLTVPPGTLADDAIDARCARLMRWGVGQATVDALLRREGISEQVLNEWRPEFYAWPENVSKAAWSHQLKHRARHHVGSSLWPTSFSSWPALPVLDQELLAVTAGLPMSTLGERRAQIELVCGRFPDLAALPLDRNGWDPAPLKPRLRYQLIDAVRNRIGWPRGRPAREERRYYYRIADFNNPAWTAIRRSAEPSRTIASGILDPPTLAKALPDPDTRVRVPNGIVDTSGHKLLTGFLLWAGSHLS